MPGTDPTPSDPRRFSISLPRPLWIGVAAIVLLVVACGLHFGVPIYRQELAVCEIERLGGFVETYPLPRKPLPTWMWRYDCLRDISVVKLGELDADDGTLACLGRVPAGRFYFLTLNDTQATDAGLAHLKRLTRLQFLDLQNTRVTDAGLAALSGMTRLRSVDLSGTRVTDIGMAHLAGLATLEYLELADTAVTGAGLAHLEGLRNLKSLSLKNSRATDAGLVGLRALASLEDLDLSGTLVTDAGLSHLKELRGLEYLKIADTQVSAIGVAELLDALPALFIHLGSHGTAYGSQYRYRQ